MKPKVVILCGGFGLRLGDETKTKPKPMIEIGGKPLLWHIMMIYSYYGFNRFVIALGYHGEVIKEYFMKYVLMNSDFRVNLDSGKIEIMRNASCDWEVELVDTGLHTMTGGRLKRLESLVDTNPFLLTYGDGVADINIDELYRFHRKMQAVATVTIVHPTTKYGVIKYENDLATFFAEKPEMTDDWINGGFFVCEPSIFSYFSNNDQESFEKTVLVKLACERKLAVYRHEGFWECLDTQKDKESLSNWWKSGSAPWCIW